MNDLVTELSSRQRAAIRCLVTHSTTEEAARAANVSSLSIRRWLEGDDNFRIALARAEAEVVKEAGRLAGGAAVKAVETLWEILEDPEASRHERIKAANYVLTHLPRLKLLSSVSEAIEELKAQAQGYNFAVESNYKILD